MRPDFTEFIFAEKVSDAVAVRSRDKKAQMGILIDWKDNPSATSFLITAPDGTIWRITAEEVKRDNEVFPGEEQSVEYLVSILLDSREKAARNILSLAKSEPGTKVVGQHKSGVSSHKVQVVFDNGWEITEIFDKAG